MPVKDPSTLFELLSIKSRLRERSVHPDIEDGTRRHLPTARAVKETLILVEQQVLV
jgi:hypothetical protein|tara:strand:+ start:105 stop:272 length:168 start_codon:yes stop_codon:yes gene_type:complete